MPKYKFKYKRAVLALLYLRCTKTDVKFMISMVDLVGTHFKIVEIREITNLKIKELF